LVAVIGLVKNNVKVALTPRGPRRHRVCVARAGAPKPKAKARRVRRPRAQASQPGVMFAGWPVLLVLVLIVVLTCGSARLPSVIVGRRRSTFDDLMTA
jgi:hypothetical protein